MTWQGKWCSVSSSKEGRSRKVCNPVPEPESALKYVRNSMGFQGLHFQRAGGDGDDCIWGSKNQVSEWGSLCDATVLINVRNKSKGLTAQTRFHQAFKHIVVFCNPSSSIYFSRGSYAKEVKACCREHLRSLTLRPSWNADCIAFTQHELLLNQNQKETTTKAGFQVCALCTHKAPCKSSPNTAWAIQTGWFCYWLQKGKHYARLSITGRRKTYKRQTQLQRKMLSFLWSLLEWKMWRLHFRRRS